MRVIETVCNIPGCGDMRKRRSSDGKYMSRMCPKHFYQSVRDRDWNKNRDWRVEPTIRTCRICQTQFTGTSRAVCCSQECSKENHRQLMREVSGRRRAAKRTNRVGVVKPDEVFARDGYRCHICGMRTSRKGGVSSPHYPTVDHLVPLSRGGEHSMANVGTACRRCNVARSNRGAAQLALI